MMNLLRKVFLATKAPRHQETQSDEYQFNNLGESFVPWCLGGIFYFLPYQSVIHTEFSFSV